MLRPHLRALGLLTLTAFCALPARGDDLRRRGLIGVQLGQVTDAEKERNKITGGAIQVQGTVPDMPAAKAGMQANDIIIKIGGESFADLAAGMALMRKYFAGDKLTFTLVRSGEETTAELTLAEKPREKSDDFEIVYDSAGEAGKRVRTLVSKPKGEGKHPAVLLLPSLNPMSIEFAQPMMARHPYKQISDRLTRAGYVVMRVERPAQGDSEGSDPQHPRFADDIAAYSAALDKLQAYPYVDADHVYLFAHSLGSVVAPQLAARDKVAGIITFAAIGRPLTDSLIETMETRWKLEAAPADEIKKNSEGLRTFFTAVLSEGKSPAEVSKAHPEVAPLLEGLVENGEFIMGSHYTYWQELAKNSTAEGWKKVDAPVLVMWGEADFMAPRSDSEALAAAVNAAHAGRAEFVTIPKCDHQLDTASDTEESFLAGFSGNFNAAVIDKVTEWAGKQQKS
jgi:pimeloyl-ACP methyl ester carboxylesterase